MLVGPRIIKVEEVQRVDLNNGKSVTVRLAPKKIPQKDASRVKAARFWRRHWEENPSVRMKHLPPLFNYKTAETAEKAGKILFLVTNEHGDQWIIPMSLAQLHSMRVAYSFSLPKHLRENARKAREKQKKIEKRLGLVNPLLLPASHDKLLER